jgi:hypothetical protein
VNSSNLKIVKNKLNDSYTTIAHLVRENISFGSNNQVTPVYEQKFVI